MKVLILEDEENIRGFVSFNLNRSGYEVVECDRGEDALRLIEEDKEIKIALLDIMLPGQVDGIEVCRQIRLSRPEVGVIFLTALAQEIDRVNGFTSGADDYVTKPFSPAELLARVDALVRRIGAVPDLTPKTEIVDPPFVLSTRHPTVTKNGVRVHITQVEYSLMRLLAENPDKIFSRQEIYNAIWERSDGKGDTKIVDVNVRRLRTKIEDDPQNPQYIVTVWGLGYRWRE